MSCKPSLVPKATYTILGLTVVIYLLQIASMAILKGDDLPLMLDARVIDLIRSGQWWRFITPVFLHGLVTHIFFNMYALLSIGSFLERHFGHGRFVLLYFLGAFAGNVFSFLLTVGYSVGFHLQDQREFREIVLGASVALLVFGALAAWGLFSG